MKMRSHVQKKNLSQSTSTPVTNPFAPRPFGIQAQTEQASSIQRNSNLDTQQAQAGVSGFNLANISIHAPGTAPPSPIQTKLTIGQPGDKYEQEADSVAAQVVSRINSPALGQSTQGSTVQRDELPEESEEVAQAKPLAGTIQREEVPEEESEEVAQAKPIADTIQRDGLPEESEEVAQAKPQEGGAVASPDIEASIQGARGSGQPLSGDVRQQMEGSFGADFGGVRVHTNAQSDQLNQSIQARAFTTGQDIFFRQGEYNPGSRGGQELLAHELTHVVQQGAAAPVQHKQAQ